jgi:hypothetical protein
MQTGQSESGYNKDESTVALKPAIWVLLKWKGSSRGPSNRGVISVIGRHRVKTANPQAH